MKELGEKCKGCICGKCKESHISTKKETEVCQEYCEVECCGEHTLGNDPNRCEYYAKIKLQF